MLHYNILNIDIVLGNESHIDSIFLSSEILPNSYKIIRKDCGIFVGFRNSLIISKLSNPSGETEMVWAKL